MAAKVKLQYSTMAPILFNNVHGSLPCDLDLWPVLGSFRGTIKAAPPSEHHTIRSPRDVRVSACEADRAHEQR